MNFNDRPMLKSELARAMDISLKTLSRDLIRWESEIKEVFPDYKRSSRLLYPVVINFIIKKTGFEKCEIENS